MKDIGISFKEARETIGISKEEVCNDLGITEAQLNNLEDGNANAFKDIFFLKETIIKYSKYLNLDIDKIMNEFNDFVFDFTSKIPVKEIEQRVVEIKEEEKENEPKKIISPYTKTKQKRDKNKSKIYLVYLFSIIIVITIVFLVIALVTSGFKDESIIVNLKEVLI